MATIGDIARKVLGDDFTKAIGQIAYEAYVEKLNSCTEVFPYPHWKDLSWGQRDAWNFAARSVFRLAADAAVEMVGAP